MTINQAIAMLQEAVACNPEAGEMILFSQVESQYGYSYYNECEALYDCTGDVYHQGPRGGQIIGRLSGKFA